MSLKRKASFTTITSPGSYSTYYNPTSTIPFLGTVTIDEQPRHLHSRTRKRFRNDRPNDQLIYDKTIKWLFSAQKKLQNSISSPVAAEDTCDSSEEPSPTFTMPDPNQQTLQKFFQPLRVSQVQQSHQRGSSVPLVQPCPIDISRTQTQQWAASTAITVSTEVDPPPALSHSVYSGIMSSEGMDVDVAMDVDCAVIEDFSSVPLDMEKRWVGGIGWM
ncbi:uncharacterized protein PADG_08517 [Paracoccidioides brasiliensis Pb18]|uniref:Uncharacterized protein n=2 Tax=Paracoccidioides brasiliensis TaxID=121759 RepID=C1GMN1_PARBD|nr:uncharacterized protein PADG_08517 [Paracoccidioides brasiliensis Pb18]EEH43697.1 hypothetical protein PADG_08517 [Paracoccidioides brasiliensis Pb18]ODH13403.1 hypothetical protein ACO22_07293 [Paracoccidioides brasiliensis]ODH46771.1 hypothetical protein GX48_07135 [Paracoccidioides brasiliensis]